MASDYPGGNFTHQITRHCRAALSPISVLDDKLSVVDVKARDAAGCLYQVEVQLLAHRDLPTRMLYGWADL